MSKKSAQEFVEKFYTNDEFIREFTLKGGLNSKATDEKKHSNRHLGSGNDHDLRLLFGPSFE
jgi:hypothetical protein